MAVLICLGEPDGIDMNNFIALFPLFKKYSNLGFEFGKVNGKHKAELCKETTFLTTIYHS